MAAPRQPDAAHGSFASVPHTGSVSQHSPDAKGRRDRRSKIHCAKRSECRRRLPFFFGLMVASFLSAGFLVYFETRTHLTLLFIGALKH